MNYKDVLKKLEAILVKAEQEKMFGSIEIIVRGGRTTVINKTETDRLDNGEISHAKQSYR